MILAENMKSKKIGNDQELIQSDPTSCPQNQKHLKYPDTFYKQGQETSKLGEKSAKYQLHSRHKFFWESLF